MCSAADDGSSDELLRKPELPKMPRATEHGRSRIGPGKAFADQMAFDAAMARYKADKEHYDDVLYPAYRAAKKRAARPANDGEQAVQRRRSNPVLVSNHRQREQDARGCVSRLDAQETFKGQLLYPSFLSHDTPMVEAVRQWVAANEPDGLGDEWWHSLLKVAHAAQTHLTSYNSLALLTPKYCLQLDTASVEEAWTLRRRARPISEATNAAWEAAGSPYPYNGTDWIPAELTELWADIDRKWKLPMHKRVGNTWTDTSLRTYAQLVDDGYNMETAGAWTGGRGALNGYDAKGWRIESKEQGSEAEGSKSEGSEADEEQASVGDELCEEHVRVASLQQKTYQQVIHI